MFLSVIASQQTAYVQNRYVKEEDLISDILDISDKLNISHGFLLVVLKKVRFGNNFIEWIKILLTSLESWVIMDGSTTPYFKLEKGARHGDPISPYLLITALEIAFAMVKSNPNIKDINIFSHNYLYITYADDTFF